MSKRVDETGNKHGKLVVLGLSHTAGQTFWKCRCRCGRITVVTGGALRGGRSTQCRSCAKLRHGHSKRGRISSEYRSWAAMLQRCTNEKVAEHARYGGRGITVCRRWFKFKNFLADMGPKPTARHTIERLKNSQGYYPWNCCWATRREQTRNTSQNILITLGGSRRALVDWLTIYGLKRATYDRRVARGWSPIAAICTPVQPKRITPLFLRTRYFKKKNKLRKKKKVP
jgi:hypothetical protein